MKILIMILCFAFSAILQAETKVLVFAGSTQENSVNKKLAEQAAAVASQLGAAVTLIDLKDYPIPFYDGDLEAKEGMPEKARELRQLMVESNLIVIASPNYNGSLSAVLKNVLDWASRGENGGSSKDAFKGKQFAIMSASPGRKGGVKGLPHLRMILENIGGEVILQQVAVGDAYNVFKDPVKIEKVKQEIQQTVQEAINKERNV